MVRAILDGRKTVTRRVVKLAAWMNPHHAKDLISPLDRFDRANVGMHYVDENVRDYGALFGDSGSDVFVRCPYGEPGSTLWVRETCDYIGAPDSWPPGSKVCDSVIYRADDPPIEKMWNGRWCSPLLMPRWASRIDLVVKAVRVERLDDITVEDALAEGVVVDRITPDGRTIYSPTFCAGGFESAAVAYRVGFRALAKLAFTVNPWVWVVTFERAPS